MGMSEWAEQAVAYHAEAATNEMEQTSAGPVRWVARHKYCVWCDSLISTHSPVLIGWPIGQDPVLTSFGVCKSCREDLPIGVVDALDEAVE